MRSPRWAGSWPSCRSTRGSAGWWSRPTGTACCTRCWCIAAALSIQDPRERPQDKQQAAAQAHARFADETSDFLAYWNLWTLPAGAAAGAGLVSAFRRLCKQEFLNHLRIREWQDLHTQLRQVTRQLGLVHETPHPDGVIDSDRVHQSLLAGLLSQVGLRDVEKREYVGARGARFSVVPGSALSKKPPRWVMAAELVETNRLWGRGVARVEPEWVEALAGHLRDAYLHRAALGPRAGRGRSPTSG